MNWKYNEEKILKDVEDYIVSTYGSHYCGHQQEYQGVQTIDFMAAKELASDFCQANIIKYNIIVTISPGNSTALPVNLTSFLISLKFILYLNLFHPM